MGAEKKLVPVDGELSKVSVDMQFDPERSFAASPGDYLYRRIPKFYWNSHQQIVFDEAARECERVDIWYNSIWTCTIEAFFRWKKFGYKNRKIKPLCNFFNLGGENEIMRGFVWKAWGSNNVRGIRICDCLFTVSCSI